MHFVSELQICPIFAQPFNLYSFNYQPSPVAFLLSDNFYTVKVYLVSCIMVMVCNAIVLFWRLQQLFFVLLSAPSGMLCCSFLKRSWGLANIFLGEFCAWYFIYCIFLVFCFDLSSFLEYDITQCLGSFLYCGNTFLLEFGWVFFPLSDMGWKVICLDWWLPCLCLWLDFLGTASAKLCFLGNHFEWKLRVGRPVRLRAVLRHCSILWLLLLVYGWPWLFLSKLVLTYSVCSDLRLQVFCTPLLRSLLRCG